MEVVKEDMAWIGTYVLCITIYYCSVWGHLPRRSNTMEVVKEDMAWIGTVMQELYCMPTQRIAQTHTPSTPSPF